MGEGLPVCFSVASSKRRTCLAHASITGVAKGGFASKEPPRGCSERGGGEHYGERLEVCREHRKPPKASRKPSDAIGRHRQAIRGK